MTIHPQWSKQSTQCAQCGQDNEPAGWCAQCVLNSGVVSEHIWRLFRAKTGYSSRFWHQIFGQFFSKSIFAMKEAF